MDHKNKSVHAPTMIPLRLTEAVLTAAEAEVWLGDEDEGVEIAAGTNKAVPDVITDSVKIVGESPLLSEAVPICSLLK